MIPVNTYIEYKYLDILSKFSEVLNWESVDLEGKIQTCKFICPITFISINEPEYMYIRENRFVYLFNFNYDPVSFLNISVRDILKWSESYSYNDKTIHRISMHTIVRFLMSANLLPKVSLIISNS